MPKPKDLAAALAAAPLFADVIRSQIAELTSRGMIAEARDLTACVLGNPSDLAPCVGYGAQLLARQAFAAVESSTSKGSKMPYSPALIAAVTRGGAAARRDFTSTARALDNVPASVRDFAGAVQRARMIQDAEKRSRLMKIGAVVVGGLALVYFLRGRK